MRFRYGSAAFSVSIADSALWSRRKHMMSSVEMPNRSSLVASARLRPPTTVSIETPRAMCACGSKKISACRTPCSAARAR